MPRRRPKPLPLGPHPNLEISRLRQEESIFQAHGVKLDRLYRLGSALGFQAQELRKAAEAIDTYLPMFEIAAKEEGLDL